MKIKDGFELVNQDGINLVVYKGVPMDKPFDTSITLDRSTAFLFNCLKSGEKTKEQLLNALLLEFDISTVLALNDIDIFVKTLKQNGIIEE